MVHADTSMPYARVIFRTGNLLEKGGNELISKEFLQTLQAWNGKQKYAAKQHVC